VSGVLQCRGSLIFEIAMAKKKHTPGRDHRRKSDLRKQEKFQKKIAKQRREADGALKEAWAKWDQLSEEQKKLLPELRPGKPRPSNDR